MEESIKIAKIEWACRRGMLELDFILKEFLADGFKKLSSKGMDEFLRFLENDDPDLYSWLMGFRNPVTENDIKMVNTILSGQQRSFIDG